MTLIKVPKKHALEDLPNSVIRYYRNNPIIAANHLLRIDGQPLTLAPIQEVLLEDWWNSKFSLTTASRGFGKSVAVGTRVLTNLGWILIEDINIGDIVITPEGKETEVVGVYPQGYLPTYKVKLSKNRSCYCSHDHLWTVRTSYDVDYQTITTKAVKELHSLGNNIYLPPVTIARESTAIDAQIISIEDSIDMECICIKIKDSSGLFIIDDYIVTHNTFCAAVYSSLRGTLYPGTSLGVFAPAFRQSKFIFKEFTRLYQNSPYLQECIAKEPTQLNDHCICTFKTAANGMKPSSLTALPIGNDGGKIRGSRFNCLLLDEVVHIPESIFRGAIHPMMSTASNPMQKVREIERLKEQYGEDIELDLESVSDNGYIGITSGYYQFNYWWNEMLNYYERIKKGSNKYSLRFIPYTELPVGFYDESIVEDAKLNSPRHIFLTEWMAEWIADSEGAFSMSLLESAREPTLIPRPFRDLNKDKGKEFIFGIDVARERDSSAIIVIELGYPSRLVHIVELEEIPFPEQSKIILQMVENFNPVRVYMDEYGGGQTLRDHFKDPTAIGLPEHYKVISVDEPTFSSGRRILRACNPNPQFLDDANNNTKTLLEQRMIILPAATHPIEASKKTNAGGIKKEVDLVQELINQVATIVVTPTPSGRLHYDLPKTKASVISYNPEVRKKDLYSAFILACKCVYDLQWITSKIQPMTQQGVIKEINSLERIGLTNPSDSSILSSDSRVVGNNILSNKNSNNLNVNIKIPNGGVILSRNVRKRR